MENTKNFDNINEVKKKWDNILLYEADLNIKNNWTSYTINKGEKLILCLRDKITTKFTNINTIIYVAIHELWHIFCKEIGHTEIFYKINKILLKNAIELSIYKYVDYSINNELYCNNYLTNNIL